VDRVAGVRPTGDADAEKSLRKALRNFSGTSLRRLMLVYPV
jgi:hypothetical protein